jgi:Flp pilus assembly protein TadG
MMMKRICHDNEGVAAVEMALALPILLSFIYGIFQMGAILAADAGMQHALGEGARFATLCVNPTQAGCNSPTVTQVQTRMQDKIFGIQVGTFDVGLPVVASGHMDLQIDYRVSPNFLFFSLPQFTVTRTKRVYLSL